MSKEGDQIVCWGREKERGESRSEEEIGAVRRRICVEWGGVGEHERKGQKVDSTPHCSRVVPHPSTKRAQTALTSVFG
jgi:hypothetical protein